VNRFGLLDAEPDPVPTELVIHMDERGRCHRSEFVPELPGNNRVHLEVGHVVKAHGKR